MQIETQIAKLKEDSARDVQRQLEQQRLAAREGEVEEVCSNDCGSELGSCSRFVVHSGAVRDVRT